MELWSPTSTKECENKSVVDWIMCGLGRDHCDNRFRFGTVFNLILSRLLR